MLLQQLAAAFAHYITKVTKGGRDMKNDMKKTLAVILAAVMLTACTKTPDNVKSSSLSDSLQDSSQTEPSQPDSTQMRKTMNEADFEKYVQASRDSILAGSYDNIAIDSNFKVYASAYPSSYQTVVPSGYDKNADVIFNLFLPDKTQGYYPSKKQLHTNEDTGVGSYEYTNGTTTGFVSSDGTVAIVDNEYMNKAIYGNTIPVNETRNLIMPVTDDKLSLGLSSLDLRDVQKKAAEKLNSFITVDKENTAVQCELDYKPFSVSTVTEQSGETLAFLHCRLTIDNTPLFDTVPIGENFPSMAILSGPMLAFNAKGNIVQINKGQSLEIKSAEKPKQILTAEYAFEAASKALAPHLEHTARFEELVLVPTVVRTDTQFSHIDLKPGDSVTLKPYWVIHFETEWWKEVYAAVNAVTGEVEYVRNRL